MYIKIKITPYGLDIDDLLEYCKYNLKFDDITFLSKEKWYDENLILNRYNSWFYFKYTNTGFIFTIDCINIANKDYNIIYSSLNGLREFFIDFVRNEKLRYIESL